MSKKIFKVSSSLKFSNRAFVYIYCFVINDIVDWEFNIFVL